MMPHPESVRAGSPRNAFTWAHAVLLVASLYPLVAAFRCGHSLNDDAYITLTYSKNLAASRGFVFNHPPPTMGTTTPLLAVAVGVLARLLPGADCESVAAFLTAGCWIGTAWLLFFSGGALGLSRPDSLVLALFVLSSGWPTLLGQETFLFEFLLVLGIVCFFRQRWLASGTVAGLLFLARGEGILLVPLLVGARFLEAAVHRGPGCWRRALVSSVTLLIGFAVPALAWSFYAYSAFGRVLPQTLEAKRAQTALVGAVPFSPQLMLQWAKFLGHGWSGVFGLGRPYPRLVLILWGLVVVGLVHSVARRPRWLVFLAWIVLYATGYTILRVNTYWWYFLPVYFVWAKFAGLGLAVVAQALRRFVAGFGSGFRVAPGLASASLVAAVLFSQWLTRFTDGVLRYRGDLRAGAYLAASEWIRDNTDPGASVAVEDVGYFGYFTDNRIADLYGLTRPEVIPYVARGDLAGGFWSQAPDYYVQRDGTGDSITAHPEFSKLYHRVATIVPPHVPVTPESRGIGVEPKWVQIYARVGSTPERASWGPPGRNPTGATGEP